MIDLEDGSLLQGLPSSQSSVQHQSCSPPTSAQLHLLAASVTNSTQTNTEIKTEEHTAESPGTEIKKKKEIVYHNNIMEINCMKICACIYRKV